MASGCFLSTFVSECLILFVLQHEDFLLALQMNEEQYQKVF